MRDEGCPFPSSFFPDRFLTSKMWLHRYATFVSAATVLLIVAGGLVTSTSSGLAVPDWPTSYGWNMFTFPMKHMVGGIFYEHGHRLIASAVGFFTIILAAWIWRVERRRWLRTLGVAALIAVCVQGLLGGITVLYFLPTPVSTAHAGLAQIFFCLTVSIALFTSPAWIRPVKEPVEDGMLRRVATATTAIIYLQIIVGATMRHSDAGLAIPDFPTVFGGVMPPEWTTQIAIHYAHRLGAIIVTLAIAATVGHVLYHHRSRRELMRPAILLSCLVLIQVTLGAFVIWSKKDVGINTAHVVVGALTLATSLVLTLRSHRVRFAQQTEAAVRVQRPAAPHLGRSGARA
jgi:heme a synthase